jgi:Rrf2 family transcriptional regulator, iron-sulfur cluster assembly transcription factor
MLSSTSDYALRAILVLAQASDGRPLRAELIARATGSPPNYLAKTLNALAKAGFVASTRGPFGGFVLAVPASELTVARIIDCFDEPRPQSRCLLGNAPCDPRHPCSAHDRWTAIKSARRAALADTTVADLVGDPSASPNQHAAAVPPLGASRCAVAS